MKWKKLRSKMAFDHQWCRVRQDTVELPNGTIIDDFFVNIRPDIAVVLAITPQQEIIFVRQYRHGVEKILLELPAGSFDPKIELPEIAARRELAEETGYRANKLIQLATLYDNPVKDTNSVHLFLAENVQYANLKQLDITEEIDVVLISIQDVKDKIRTGEICVAGSITALFLGLDYLQQNRGFNLSHF
jgi:8-oxo-dGTP pyrophosphatase MutT (NUDIX family)